MLFSYIELGNKKDFLVFFSMQKYKINDVEF